MACRFLAGFSRLTLYPGVQRHAGILGLLHSPTPRASNLVHYCSGTTLEHVTSLREIRATGKNVTHIVVYYNGNRHYYTQMDALLY